jgi:hypothetical protein
MRAKRGPVQPFTGLVLALRLQLRDPVFRAAFAILVTVMGIGTLFYMLVEGWGLLDALYFCVVTSATVGFGDLAPTTDLAKAFTIVYIFVSVGMLVLVLSRLAGGMVQLRLERTGDDPQLAAAELDVPVELPPPGPAGEARAGQPRGRPGDSAADTARSAPSDTTLGAPADSRPGAPADTPPDR